MPEHSNIDRVSMIVLRSMRTPLSLLFSVYAIGIAGFALIPGASGSPMSFFHATYFLSYTATTTGFGELPVPFSNAQRLWAIVLLHISVIAWLYSIGAIIRLVQNPHFQRAVARHVFARRVNQFDEPFAIICGFGDAGSLLARGLNDQDMAAVVVDNDPDRIKAFNLRNFVVRVLGVCADSGNPGLLLEAGVKHPHCLGIVAVTDDDDTNTRTAIMARVLNPSLVPICCIESRNRGRELKAIGSVVVLDAFEIFADRLSVALQRPALHALGDWLVRAPGASLDYRMNCPTGRWIVCGYGRMGQRLAENLCEQGVEVIVIDPEITEEKASDAFIRGTANSDTLEEAGVADAACIIVATDDDSSNLAVMMLVREFNSDAFLVVRQNDYRNELAFANAEADLVMHPDRVTSRRIQLELVSPNLQPLLDHLQNRPASDLDDLFERLRSAMDRDLPVLWITDLSVEHAPALQGRQSQEATVVPALKDLMRSPYDREQLVGCVPLILHRGDEQYRIPALDLALEPGDRILFCGTRAARATLEAVLQNPYTLQYLVSGDTPPRSYLVRDLLRRRQASMEKARE